MKDVGMSSKLAAIQMTGGMSLSDNLDQARSLIELAAKKGAKLIVLPENFAYFGQKEIKNIAKTENSKGPARKFLAEQAIRHKVWIVGGTIPIKADHISLNHLPSSSCFVLDDKGYEVACYQKIHLFDAVVDDPKESYCESSEYSPGNLPVIIDTPIGRLGIAICYDLRFPELFSYLSAHGAEVIAIPSAFTSQTGEPHWSILLRARAIENLIYIIGANMGNRQHPKSPTWGGSAIIDPWGNVISQLEEGLGIVTADIDLSYLKGLRNNLPVHEHRRFNIIRPK